MEKGQMLLSQPPEEAVGVSSGSTFCLYTAMLQVLDIAIESRLTNKPIK